MELFKNVSGTFIDKHVTYIYMHISEKVTFSENILCINTMFHALCNHQYDINL